MPKEISKNIIPAILANFENLNVKLDWEQPQNLPFPLPLYLKGLEILLPSVYNIM